MQQAGGGEYDVDPELTEYVRGVGGLQPFDELLPITTKNGR